MPKYAMTARRATMLSTLAFALPLLFCKSGVITTDPGHLGSVPQLYLYIIKFRASIPLCSPIFVSRLRSRSPFRYTTSICMSPTSDTNSSDDHLSQQRKTRRLSMTKRKMKIRRTIKTAKTARTIRMTKSPRRMKTRTRKRMKTRLRREMRRPSLIQCPNLPSQRKHQVGRNRPVLLRAQRRPQRLHTVAGTIKWALRSRNRCGEFVVPTLPAT